jgi:glycosyltransferase involved in cell wall biosynthesis
MAVGTIALVLKGYPRLSETFIAQEILALEQQGFSFQIWSLRQPTDKYTHLMHQRIVAPLFYLPEYLHDAPLRVLRAIAKAVALPGFGLLLRHFLRDLKRDLTLNRIRRFGQACVLATELDPMIRHLHVHFLHTPGSVVRYACLLSGRRFSFSAHAKDIWTIPDWEKREKIADAQWGVACTADGVSELRRASRPSDRDKVHLIYHGLDIGRFPDPPAQRPFRDGSKAEDPVRIVSVGRAVEKKGFDDLIAALARVSGHWRLVHIGSGPMIGALKEAAARAGILERVEWRGSKPQHEVIAALQEADLFVLPSKPGPDGDRDGLPNVLMEAATQGLPLVSTRFAAVPEFVRDGEMGLLVEPGDSHALAIALEKLLRDPQLRIALGSAARSHVVEHFSFEAGISTIGSMLTDCANREVVRKVQGP